MNEPQAFNPATNRVTGSNWSYDEAGNVLTDGATPGMTYDGENRLASSGTYSYGYDGMGQRVRRTIGSQATNFVYGPDGELVAEYWSPVTTSGRQYVTV